MRKIIFIIACGYTLTYAQGVYAQTVNVNEKNQNDIKKKTRQSPEDRAKRSVTALDKIVSLSEEQKTKVYDMALKRAKSVDAVLEKYRGQVDKKELAKQEIYHIRKNYRLEIKSILTLEQIEKLKQYHKSKHPHSSGKIEDAIPDEN